MIEVVIAALLVALIAGATFTGFAAVSHASGAQRHEEQAAQLAQQDEARLRGLSATELAATAPSGTCSATAASVALFGNACYVQTVDNESFTITSSSKFVSASSGAVSCTGTTSADYIETSSAVTWSNKNDGRPTVMEHSLVSPPLGGALITQVNDPNGNGLAGVSIAVTGPTDAGAISSTQTLQTDSDGCAVFGGLAGGTYQVTYSDPGYITVSGVALPYSAPSLTIVSGQTETLTPLQIGDAGTAVVGFTTSVSDTPQAVNWDSFSIGDFSNNAVLPSPQTFTTSPAAANVSSGATVFPATYSAYAGTCTADDPSGSTGTTGLTGSSYVDPTVTVPGGATGATTTLVVPTMLLQPTLSYTPATGTTTFNDDLNSSNPAGDTTDSQLSYTSGGTTITYAGSGWNYSGPSYTAGSNAGTGSGSGDYARDETWSTATGNTVTVTFTGTSIKWLTPLAGNHGFANVSLYQAPNGVQGTQVGTTVSKSDYSANPEQYQSQLYSSPTLPFGTYQLVISVAGGTPPPGSSGDFVSIDGFIVGNTGGTLSTAVTNPTLPYTVKTYDSCPTPVARTVATPVTATTVGPLKVYPVQAPYGTSVQVCFANSATSTNTGDLPSTLPQIGNTNLNGTSVTALTLPVTSSAINAGTVFSSAGPCP
jgi:collagen type VII alpha